MLMVNFNQSSMDNQFHLNWFWNCIRSPSCCNATQRSGKRSIRTSITRALVWKVLSAWRVASRTVEKLTLFSVCLGSYARLPQNPAHTMQCHALPCSVHKRKGADTYKSPCSWDTGIVNNPMKKLRGHICCSCWPSHTTKNVAKLAV